ncbi:hypothetical protein CYLTODRAFT_361491 [Cylindrobasidium torrendii FP15055 ss-10]|uniref:Uncharacterized protein n=1 Tax=Cylindrobasidium torrendii FP15055 ss-10 TaxID=1314674 RepID=A0A0D7AWQ9_9AGAR|nr:hypothetical protein CYLTODRAFT_361491 [Cylindrobasidium torrendii FP15055 ss-10]
MSNSSRARSASTTTSVRPQPSVRSGPAPIQVPIVVTEPPWARDEPPSPTDDATAVADDHPFHRPESRPSDVGSLSSSVPPSRWWAFTLPRPREHNANSSAPEEHRKSTAHTLKDWLPSTPSVPFREGSSFARGGPKAPTMSERRAIALSIEMPPPPPSLTLAQTQTPGWETPWTSRPAAQGPRHRHHDEEEDDIEEEDSDQVSLTDTATNISTWQRRKKRIRSFILTNVYVPLLFRFINITFSAAALGLAIRVRAREKQHNIMGAVGSSPTLVIIFAPLTILHVLIAIYLEYFGRPLGLWRTSGKLAHTLLDVLFICMWSSALSLCFDNFFSSLIPCTSVSATSWYNELPRPPSNLPTFEGSIGDAICDSQLALICLVAMGLVMYCINLVISLFRIFEKVKYHPNRMGLVS